MLLRLALLLIVFTPIVNAQEPIQDVCVQCPPGNENVEGTTIKSGRFNFTWTSEWHAFDSKKKCFFRQITNNAKRSLYYSWPLAGFELNVALGSGESNRRCTFGRDERKPVTSAALHYGRGGYKAPTKVWLNTDENDKESRLRIDKTIRPNSESFNSHKLRFLRASTIEPVNNSKPTQIEHSPLLTTYKISIRLADAKRRYLFFVPLPRKHRTYKVDMTFSSTVKPTKDGYEVRNTVASLNPEQELPYVEWKGVSVGAVSAASSASAGAGGLFGLSWIGTLKRLLWSPRSTPQLPTPTKDASITRREATIITRSLPMSRTQVVPIYTNSGEDVIRLHVSFWSAY